MRVDGNAKNGSRSERAVIRRSRLVLTDRLRQDDGVDDVDHAIARHQIGGDHSGAVNHDGAMTGHEGGFLTVHRLDLAALDVPWP